MADIQVDKTTLLKRLLPFDVGNCGNYWGRVYMDMQDVSIILKDGVPIGIKNDDCTVIGADFHVLGTTEISLEDLKKDPSNPLYHFTVLKTKNPVIGTRLRNAAPNGRKDYQWAAYLPSVLMYKLGIAPYPKWVSKDAAHQAAFQQILTNLGDLKWLTA